MRTWEPLSLCLWSDESEKSHLWMKSPGFVHCARSKGCAAKHFLHVGALPPLPMPQGSETRCQFCSSQSPAQMRRHLPSKSSHIAKLRLCAGDTANSLQWVVE